jgi:hypothetical protein
MSLDQVRQIAAPKQKPLAPVLALFCCGLTLLLPSSTAFANAHPDRLFEFGRVPLTEARSLFAGSARAFQSYLARVSARSVRSQLPLALAIEVSLGEAEVLEVPSAIETAVREWQLRYERESRREEGVVDDIRREIDRNLEHYGSNPDQDFRVNFARYRSLWEFLSALQLVDVEVNADTKIGVFLQAGRDPFLFVNTGVGPNADRWIGAFLGAGVSLDLGPFRQLLTVSYYALSQLDAQWEFLGGNRALPFMTLQSGWAASARTEVRLMELFGGDLSSFFTLQFEDYPGAYRHVFGVLGLRWTF